jgi:hypothetical protein
LYTNENIYFSKKGHFVLNCFVLILTFKKQAKAKATTMLKDFIVELDVGNCAES